MCGKDKAFWNTNEAQKKGRLAPPSKKNIMKNNYLFA